MINEPKKSIRSVDNLADSVDDAFTSDADSLHQSLKRLDNFGKMLRLFGMYILVCTVININVSILLITSLRLFLSALNMTRLSVGTAGFAILFAIAYDIRRRQGDAIFEEVSDELQWRIQRTIDPSQHSYVTSNSPTSYANKRPELNERIILRTYARASELPVIPGKYGALSYVLINLVLVILNGIYAHRYW